MSEDNDSLPANWPKHAASVVNNFTNKISKAVGTWYEPTNKRRMAKADADAKKIALESQLESELRIRAFKRMMHEEERKQINMEAVIEGSYEHIKETAKPEQMDDDWLSSFFERAQKVSDEQMRSIWAKVLAGEANSPGTYTKSTLQALSMLEKPDAELFTGVCRFSIDGNTPVIYDSEAAIYHGAGVNFQVLAHLDDIGLLSFEHLTGYQSTVAQGEAVLKYGKVRLKVTLPEGTVHFPLGKVMLTKTGKQLLPLSNAKIVPDFVEYLIEKLKTHKITAEVIS